MFGIIVSFVAAATVIVKSNKREGGGGDLYNTIKTVEEDYSKAIAEAEKELAELQAKFASTVSANQQSQAMLVTAKTALSSAKSDYQALTNHIQTLEKIKISKQKDYKDLLELSKAQDQEIVNKLYMFNKLIEDNKDNSEFKNYFSLFKFRKCLEVSDKSLLTQLKYEIDIKGFDINFKDEIGKTALFYAVHSNNFELVQKLITQGANVNAQSILGYTPLHLALLSNRFDMAKLLMDNGSNINIPDVSGLTPLLNAARVRDLDKVYKILELGADITLSDYNDINLLHYILDTNQGINLNVENAVIEIQVDYNKAEVLERVNKMQKINPLYLDKPKKEKGNYPMHLAYFAKQMHAVKKLVELGFNVNVFNNQGVTPLHIAASIGDIEAIEYFIKKINDIDIRNKEVGATPLFLAAQEGRLEVVKLLCDKGANFNIPITKGVTPLHIAAIHNQIEVVKLLYSKDADINTHDNEMFLTPLISACHNNSIEIASLIVNKVKDINFKTSQGATALHIATANNEAGIAKILIEHGGADINAVAMRNATPIWLAAQNNCIDVLKLLIEKKADLTMQDTKCGTPLHIAIAKGHFEAVKLFLEAKLIDINTQNAYGATVLHMAVEKNNVEIAKVLIEHGAGINAVAIRNATPIWFAAQNNCIDVLKLLIERHADLTVQDTKCGTPLHIAISQGHLEAVKILVESNLISIDTRNTFSGSTPLYFAAFYKHNNILEYLINQGADLNISNKGGITPLMAGIVQKNLEGAEILIKHGANLNKVNNNGDTALRAAIDTNQKNIVKELIRTGASLDIVNNKGEKILDLLLKDAEYKAFLEENNLLSKVEVSFEALDLHDHTAAQDDVIMALPKEGEHKGILGDNQYADNI